MGEWQRTTVGKVASDFLSGGTPATSRADYWTGEIPWITSKWLGYKLELTTGEKLISEEAVKNTATKIVPKDSIIFATRVGVGKVGINRIDLAINQDLAGVLIDKEKYDIKFLAYQLETDSIQQYVEMNKRGATIKGITRDCLEQIQLNIPPLPEQRKIAHILSTVQRAIEAQERIIQTTTELKKAFMHKLFTEGLRNEPQKETEIGLVPESWELKAMNEICDLIIDCPHTTPRFSNSGVFIARNFNFKDAQFIPEPAFYTSEDEYLLRVKRATPMPGDVLFSREAPIGEACVIPSNTRLSLGQRTMFLRTKRSHLLPYFLVYSFYSENVRRLMLSTAGGLTLPHLNVGDVRKMLIPVPSLKDQEGIINMLLSVERKKELHRRNLSSLQDLFRTLLYELMTAKIRVHKLEVTL